MRIAMISPLEMRVPPVAYGGTELVVSLLTEELIKRGHDVTLFASGDSVTSAKLVSVCPNFLRGSGRDAGILTMLSVVTCLEQADKFDIIHNHTCFEGLATSGLVKTPILTTLHGDLKGDWLELFNHYKGWYNTISYSAKSLLPEKERFAGVIYNSIDVNSYPFGDSRREPTLLFLSRISYEKGPHLAIEVAKKSHRRLVIAGNVHPSDEEYFRTMVMPNVDGDQIQYIGEADYERKRELMSQAYCLIAPITWPEPFGLFFVEAMACGTPVVVFSKGSAPEVVKHGETGFVVDTVNEMVDALDKVHQIDRKRCRKYVEEKFDVYRMVDDYLKAYKRVLSEEGGMRKGKPMPGLGEPLESTIDYSMDSSTTPEKVTASKN